MPNFGDVMKTLNTITLALLCLCYSCSQPTPNAALKRKADSLDIIAKANKMAQQIIQRSKDSAANAQRAHDSQAAAQPRRNYGPCPVAVKKCLLISDGHGGKAL